VQPHEERKVHAERVHAHPWSSTLATATEVAGLICFQAYKVEDEARIWVEERAGAVV
jgi:hypothetical protein